MREVLVLFEEFPRNKAIISVLSSYRHRTHVQPGPPHPFFSEDASSS